MRQRVITGILFTVGVAAFVIPSFWFPWIILLFTCVIGAFSLDEMVKALKSGKMEPSVPLVLIGGIIAIVLSVITLIIKCSLTTALSFYLMVMMIYCFAVIILPSIFRTDKNHVDSGLISAASVLYVTFPLYCLAAITMLLPNGWYYMVPALFAAWISDTCAYFSGVTLGKHKIVPHISPKKTWEGCVGGAIGCAAIVTLYFDLIIYRIDEINMNIVLFSVIAFILGFIMSVMSQIGDWMASLVKRYVGIKDYGNLFPGHGGMIDRFDSVFFTIPVGVLLAMIAQLI